MKKTVKIISVTKENKEKFFWELELPIDDRHKDGHGKRVYKRYDPSRIYYCLRDHDWSGTFGEFQKYIIPTKQSFEIIVDFSQLSWADPLPLLSIATSLRGFVENSSSQMIVNLGADPINDDRRSAFLKFLAEHEFLKLFSFESTDSHRQPNFIFDNTIWPDSKLYNLENKLKSFRTRLAYDESLCLRAKIYGTDTSTKITSKDIVASCVEELNDNVILPLFEDRPDLIDPLLHKLKVILFELIENAYLHAFNSDGGKYPSKYFSIYGRIRKGAHDQFTRRQLEFDFQKERDFCPTIKNYNFTPDVDWVEIFYYDSGKGILADLAEWQNIAKLKKPAQREEFEKTILKFKGTTNKLVPISTFLFHSPISKFNRKDKTVLTGLQHIGLTLSANHDFARLLTENEWAGSHHPWRKNQVAGVVNLRKDQKFNRIHHHTKGTTWHFCMPVVTRDTKLPEEWITHEIEEKFKTINTNKPISEREISNYTIIDERDIENTSSPIGSKIPSDSILTENLIWLPKDITKQYIKKWLSYVCGDLRKDPFNKIKRWIIADLSAYPASIVAQIIKREPIYLKKNIEIYIVCQDWRCTCISNVSKTKVDGSLEISKEKAEKFLKNNIVRLFRILRYIDSKLFWEGIPSSIKEEQIKDKKIPFVYEKIFWESSDGSEFELDGYLDLSQALTSPLRSLVCQRALLRTWYLFTPRKQCIPADNLVTDLIPEGSSQQNGHSIVHVSSVVVSGSTVSLKNRRTKGSIIHLFQHAFVDQTSTQRSKLSENQNAKIFEFEAVAMEWMKIKPNIYDPPTDKLPYKRIPGTPFIGRGGAKAIPIRRFDRPQPGNDDYFAKELKFYGEPPQEMYDHILQLNSLKIGHWKYEGHHDLFTFNLGKAYRIERNTIGPLVKWLIDSFKELSKSCMLVYPSHPVTDFIFRHLQLKHKDCLPNHVIPINFLSLYSQTAIRIPSLTYDKIRKILDEQTKKRRQIIFFDDGTVTGKVMREIEQLLQNANTGDKTSVKIHTVTIINRTGLPLYRRLIKATHSTNHNYWRWDVPALGNRRMCPLCNSLGKASLFLVSLPNGEAKKAVQNWISIWQCKNVDTSWEHHGINPFSLPFEREITFGKEWLKGEETVPYKVKHSTTTGLAAMVIELIRTTSYKDVGLKIFDNPQGQSKDIDPIEINAWVHAKFEIIISQLLLFFDDLNFDELNERYERLANLLLQDNKNDEISQLGRLALLLIETDHAKYLLQTSSYLTFLKKHEIISINNLITLCHIQEKCKETDTDFINNLLRKNPSEIILKKNIDYSWFLLAGNEKDPYLKQRYALRILILLLGDTRDTMHHAYLRERTKESENADLRLIIRDMKLLKENLKDIRQEMYLPPDNSIPKRLKFDPEKIILGVNEYIKVLSKITAEDKQSKVDGLHQWLFGEDGISVRFQEEFLSDCERVRDSIILGFSRENWEQLINQKSIKDPSIKERWYDRGGLIEPEIHVEINHSKPSPLIVCPPILKQFIRDRVANVIHSNKPFSADDTLGTVDMHCTINVANNLISLRLNNYTSTEDIPKKGMLTGIIEDFLEKNFVAYQIQENKEGKICMTEIKIPTIEGM